ncbi:MAG: carboxypeptidase-like regulatory domain-containing protein [Gemmatimonadaceae bacterium]
MRTPRLLIAALIAVCIACAASDVTKPTTPVTPDPVVDAPPAGYALLSGRIMDANGNPVGGAGVFVPFGQNQNYGGTTDATGQYRFTARASDFAGVSPVAMVVYKERYLPRTYYYTSLTAGSRLTIPADPALAIRPLAPNEFIPGSAYNLWHIGDANFDGSANSRLQVSTFGKSIGFALTTWNAQMRAQYRTATITFVARGVQTRLCSANRVGIYSEVNGTGAWLSPNDSDPNGAFTAYRVQVSLAAFPDGPLFFGANAGLCSGSDLDDWEFAQVLVTLNP